MASVFIHRARRLVVSGSRVLLIAGPPIIAVALATWTKTLDLNVSIPLWITISGILGVLLLSFQAVSEYQIRTYDPTLAFKFDDRFYDAEMRTVRSKAAKLLKNNQGKLRRTDPELADIDDVLDFLDDLGFYQHGDQITPEVAHHHFYHWIRGYYLASRDYIGAWQEKEPTRWEHLAELFRNTYTIEIKRTKVQAPKSLMDKEIAIFLQEEIELCSPTASLK